MTMPATTDAAHLSAPLNAVCISCGYARRQLPTPRCPECGLAFDPATAYASVIPWEHRGNLRTWRASLQTAQLVLFGWKRLRIGLAQPLRIADALSFGGGRWKAVIPAAGAAFATLMFGLGQAGSITSTHVLSALALAGGIYAWDYGFMHLPTLALGFSLERERADSAKAVWYYSATVGSMTTLVALAIAAASFVKLGSPVVAPLQLGLQFAAALFLLAWAPLRFANIYAAARGGGAWRQALGFGLGCVSLLAALAVGFVVALEVAIISVAIYSLSS